MKTTGIVRNIDNVGRVSLPIELRRFFKMDEGDSVEILTDSNGVYIRKYVPNMTCMVTGENSERNLSVANGHIVVSPEIAEEVAREIINKLKLEV